MFAGVVVNKKTAALNRIFNYIVPEDMAVRPGQIVEVEFGRQRLEAIVVELAESVDFPAEKLKPISRIISAEPLFGKDLLALSQFAADYYLCSRASMLQAMLPAGMYLTGKMPRASLIRRVELVPQDLAVDDVMKSLRGQKQRRVLEIMQEQGSVQLPELLEQSGASLPTVNGLVDKGILRIVEESIWEGENADVPQVRHDLTDLQAEVLRQIRENFAADNKPVLLHGVTGSGKTEIYIRLAEEVREQGRQSIILVPEIALTPQTVRNFQQRLGAGVAVLHSGLTASERRAAWLGIAGGHYDLVIGARSAIFAPTPKLGLIIIDEEHEATYKQDNAPRFHTRVLAEERCRLTGASLVFGSATPDVESYYKARRGDYLLCEMPERIGGRAQAHVQLVDMSREFREGNNSVFSRLLQQKLRDNLQNGNQSLLFLNRRGYESFVSCRHCGYVVECPHCSVAMSYHIGDEVLKCHYCEQTMPPPTRCPECGSTAIRFFGAGTQKIVEAAQKLLPGARIARLDRDITVERGSYERIYQAMLRGEIDVLVGTQMIAKGLDFPNLTLVGVIAADLALNMPDLRSGERAFQLTTQVAGRAGRHKSGEVVIQTYQPQSEILHAAAEQDYKQFYKREILQRRLAEYPPFAALIRVVISAATIGEATEIGRELAWRIQVASEQILGQIKAEEKFAYFGPKPCPRAKIKDRYRLQILLKSADLGLIREIVRRAVEHIRLPHDSNLAVDVEPINIL
jgi:primosomal protein N' (replication factor Y)